MLFKWNPGTNITLSDDDYSALGSVSTYSSTSTNSSSFYTGLGRIYIEFTKDIGGVTSLGLYNILILSNNHKTLSSISDYSIQDFKCIGFIIDIITNEITILRDNIIHSTTTVDFNNDYALKFTLNSAYGCQVHINSGQDPFIYEQENVKTLNESFLTFEEYSNSKSKIKNSIQNVTNIGDIIKCRYSAAAANTVGVFSELGTTTVPEIPTSGTATPDGSFYWIFFGYDFMGRKMFIADRNIQHSISTDIINTAGFVNGNILTMPGNEDIVASIRLPTGGSANIYSDNEWDEVICTSTLDNNIPAGADDVWHWGGQYSLTSTIVGAHRVMRGNTTVDTYSSIAYNSATTNGGFRPVLLVKEIAKIDKLEFSTTNIWEPTINNIDISGMILNIDDIDLKYSILVNDVEVYASAFKNLSMYNINVRLEKDIFDIGTNTLDLIITDIDTDSIKFKYNIYKNNRDTLEYIMDLKHDISHVLHNTELIHDKGIQLKPDSETGYLLLEIPTDGKDKLKNILADDNDLIDGYQISKDNINFVGYDGADWVDSYKMTKVELNSLLNSAYSKLITEAYLDKLFIKIYFSQNIENAPMIYNLSTTFEQNQPPIIITPSVTPDSIHAEFCTLTANIKDFEGDVIDYRVLIQKAGESEFIVVDDWVNISNNGSVLKAYNKPYFNLGENKIKLEARDQRDILSEWVGTLVLTNQKPFISYTYTNYGFVGTISDDDTDAVSIQVSIDNEIILPFTQYMETPKQFKYEWDAKYIKIGKFHTIKIEIKDTYDEISEFDFNITGNYKSLMFKDEEGNYYTSDKGDILKMLDLGRVIVGENSIPKKITLVNQTNYNVYNTQITVDNNTLPEIAQVKLSLTNEPFDPLDTIYFAEVFNEGSEKEFYLSLYTQQGRGVIDAEVDIFAEGNLIE